MPTSNIQSGSRGDQVKWVQKFANDVMGAGISVDGVAGNQTVYAIKVFQQNNGLTADGIAGTHSDECVAKVDASGNVTALVEGTVTISCISTWNSNIKDTVVIHVKQETTEAPTTEEGSQITLANTIYEVVSDDEDAPDVCLLEDQSNMKKISIPAFMNCKNLKKVSLGIGLNTIEKKAFYNCKKLSKLNIYSRGIRKIGKKAFSKTSGKLTVKIPTNKKRIYKKLLRKAGLR